MWIIHADVAPVVQPHIWIPPTTPAGIVGPELTKVIEALMHEWN
jgi:hypothetical protein